MPKNFYPDNMVKRKKSRANSGGAFLSFVVVIVAGALCVMLALLFSNFITVGSFSFLNGSELKKNGYTIYAISIYQSNNFGSAGSAASSYQDKGGAGYLYFDNGIFHVLTSGYKEKSDADKVAEKLLNEGTGAQIITISVGSTALSGSFSQEEQSALNNALSSFSSSFDSLYDMSISLDTNISTENEIRTQITSLISALSTIKNKFVSTFSSNQSSEFTEIKLSLEDQIDFVQDILSISDTPLSSKIKYCYFQIVDENIDLKSALED